MTTFHAPPRARRRWLIVGAVIALLAVGLALDLAYHGLAWRTFWSLTGEESPAGQVRGMVEWLGNFTRAQPNTQPLAVIAHTGENPFGINTFLEQEVEPAKRERQLQMISDVGFAWIRQEFPWEEIEVHARGDFMDRRNMDAVGEISAWAKFDNIVDLADQYGVTIQARLSNPPTWAQANAESGNFAPSAEPQDFVNYAAAVAERYRGRIHYYQVWNEPNIYPEWGEQDVSPEAYTDLLCRTYAALKAVDPDIIVISGALAPNVELTGRNLNDFIYLQRMYDAGAADCFDILSMQGYGLYSGPTDTRMRPTTVNFSRNLYIRDLMVANDDAEKPIWISEAAWSPVGEPGVPTDIIGYGNYGKVTLEQAARYMPIAYERARTEFPWVGVMNYWFFKRAGDSEINQAFYYFRMVEPDFTPLPVYAAMRDYIAQETPTLFEGIHQEDHRAITLDEDAELVDADGAQLRQAARATGLTFTTHGTSARLRWQGADTLTIQIDNAAPFTISAAPAADSWTQHTILSTLTAETHTLRVTSSSPMLFDSVLVLNRTVDHLMPLVGAGIGVVLVALAVIAAALHRRFG